MKKFGQHTFGQIQCRYPQNRSGNEVGGGYNNRFLAYLFETVSAFGTVGLSMGVTPALSVLGKAWVILLMLVGRFGVLTFAYIIVGGGAENRFEYSEENIMIG